MSLIEGFVRNPVKVAVAVLLVMLFGVVALDRMPMQLVPEVETPTITVDTRWPGASPQEVEREIVVEQEEQLKGVEGLRKMSSQSMDSRGMITLEFIVGADMQEALLQVNSRLQQVREYPIDADEPVITSINSTNRPIAMFMLSPQRPSEAKLDQFQRQHPELSAQLDHVRATDNIGVALLRLRRLAVDHPAVNELLPPPELDVNKFRRFAEDEIESRFERVTGVGQAEVMGGLIDELQVVVDPEKLASRQVTLSQVRQVLQAQNQDTSAGDFWESKRRYVVRTLGQFRSLEQVENQLLAIRDGAPVYVRDVAVVKLGYKKPDGLVRRFGEANLGIRCIREPGSNVLSVMDELRRVNAQINKDILAPLGLVSTQVYDETDYIYASIGLVNDNIYVGSALTMIVLMLFLHLNMRTLISIPFILGTSLLATHVSPWLFLICLALILGTGLWFARGALIVGLSIPISVVGTFLALRLLDRSLNVISLAGLAFAVGMVVDAATVVLENIYRRYDEGESPWDATIRGTQEVWGAIVANTMTILAVFLPVVFVQEEAGQLFRDIALAISASVGLSLVIAVVVIPPAAARLLKPHKRKEAGGDGRGEESVDVSSMNRPPSPLVTKLLLPIEAAGGEFSRWVMAVNAWIQQGTSRQLLAVAVMVGVSTGLSWLFWPPVEYLPSGNRNQVFGRIQPPPGYNVNQLMSLGATLEEELRPYWDCDPGSPEEAALDGPRLADCFFAARGRDVFLSVRSADPLRAKELEPIVRRAGEKIPGAIIVAKQASLFEQGQSAGRTIDIEITGPDIHRLVDLGGRILGLVAENIPRAQASSIPSLDLSNPEIHVTPKLVQSAEMEVSTSDLGFAVNALVDGAYVSDYYNAGKKIDLTVVGEAKYATRTHEVGAVPIATPLGQLVPLNALADIELASGPEQINHRERMRAITIQVSPPADVPLEEAMTAIQEKIVDPLNGDGSLDGGYQINLAGTADKLRQTWRAMSFNIYLATIITYLLMAALFESWLYPFVIILTVPLGAVGGILALKLLNVFVLQPLDVLTMLGFVMLVGTVVNNPILIVHQALNYIREGGMDRTAAIMESTRTRIRPIFVTTVTTLTGLLPLVLFPGAGSELYRGMGSVMLGGLVVSTVFTLILSPTLFSLMLDAKESLAGLFGRLNRLPASAEPVQFELPDLEGGEIPGAAAFSSS